MVHQIKRFTLIFLMILALHLFWYVISDEIGVQKIFLPSPYETYLTLINLFSQTSFWIDIGASWLRVSIAFIISIIIAYPLVLLSILNENLKRGLFLIVEFFRYLPIPVFIPLTILWFGVSDMGKIVVVFLGTFTQMIPMFYDSTLLVKNEYHAAKIALKWSQLKIVKNVIIKGSAPYIFDNSRLCLGWAWTYLVVAELLGAEHGIGYAIIRAQRYLATDRIFSYIIIIGVMGILTDRIMKLSRNRLFPWA